jgi:hypothetical protein
MAHERYKLASLEPVSPGPAVIRVDFKYDGGVGNGGMATLFANDKKVAAARIDKTVPSRFGPESFDIGMDNASPVSENYKPPFAYSGTIKKVDIHIAPSNLSAGDQKKVLDGARDAAMGVE